MINQVFLTDFPFEELGDIPFLKAIVREVKIVRPIDNIWLIVEHKEFQKQVKYFYVYKTMEDYKMRRNLSESEYIENIIPQFKHTNEKNY